MAVAVQFQNCTSLIVSGSNQKCTIWKKRNKGGVEIVAMILTLMRTLFWNLGVEHQWSSIIHYKGNWLQVLRSVDWRADSQKVKIGNCTLIVEMSGKAEEEKTDRATETEIANNLYMNRQEKNRISDEISELWIWVCCNIFKFYKSLNRSGYKGCFIFLRQNVLTFLQQTSACLLVVVVATQGFLPQDLHWLGCTQWGLATKVWERSIIGNHSRNSTKVIQPRWQFAQFIAALLLYNPHSFLNQLSIN